MADQLRISGGHMSAPLLPAAHEQGLRCPRCDSPNTKFCYYNNYSLSQPRHFCKTCRRYWTRGGALRNVPVGGGCRKNKKFKSPASSRLRADPVSALPETVSPGASFLAAPRLQAPVGSQVLDVPHNYAALISSSAVPVVGFCTYPVSITGVYSNGGGTSAANNSCMDSSMESLISSMNQDLRWNLSVISGGDQARNQIPESAQRPNNSSMQWFPEIAYPVLPSGSSSAINNSNSSSSSNAKTSTSYWNGQQQAWNETLQFTALP